jgi:hypothetical protein
MAVHTPGDTTDRDLSWLDASFLADLSIDGKLLLFTEAGQGGGPGAVGYLRGTDGSAAVRLGAGRTLALSPDARRALVVSGVSSEMELLPTGTGQPRRLDGHGLGYFMARWLPDGQRIIVYAIEPGHQGGLFLHGLGPDRPTPLTPEGISPRWAVSPDGSMIAAADARRADSDLRLEGLPPAGHRGPDRPGSGGRVDH